MNPYAALSVTKRILCVGSIGIDIIETCPRLPAQGEHMRSTESRWERGGHAGNVSYVLSMLGAQVEFLGMVSESSLMRDILLEMERSRIDLSHCPRTARNPAITTVVVDRKAGCRSVVQCRRQFPYVSMEDFRKLDLDSYCWVHFEARNKWDVIPMIRAILDHNNGRTERIRVSVKVDSGYAETRDLYAMCDYLIFSRQLALDLGWQSVEETCRQLDNSFSLPRSIKVNRPSIICSWGASGAGCLNADGNYTELPAHILKRPVDTYGVGECFTAAIIYALCVREMPLPAAVAFGNRVAVSKTLRPGYNHIAQLDIYPSRVMIALDDSSVNNSEEEDETDIFCKRLLNRPIQPSDGKLATELLHEFRLPSPKPSVPNVGSEESLDGQHVSLAANHESKRRSRYSTVSKRGSMMRNRRKRSTIQNLL